MRAFLIFLGVVALAIIGLIAVGVIRLTNSNEELNISVDRAKIERGIDEVVQDTGQALEQAGEKLQQESPESERE